MRHAQLRAFHAVATWGGFSKAADRLGLSQPALSDHVRKLEEAYGVELFRRASRSVTLTEVGRKLFTLTEQQFEAEAAALELLSRARGLKVGLITIGADAAVHVLPLVSAFRARHPALSIKVITGNSRQLIEQLDRFEIDFAVVAEVAENPRYATRLLSEDRLVAFVQKAHPLARKRQIPLAALAGETFILREPGSVTRKLVEEEFSRRELAPKDTVEIEGREAAREAVAAGLGVGVISEAEFVHDPRLVRLAFSDWDVRMREWLVCLEARTSVQTIRAMLEVAGRGA
ncbi:MAG: LysR substrate-binding domain-containing protein [Parvibaculaceae bacterium]